MLLYNWQVLQPHLRRVLKQQILDKEQIKAHSGLFRKHKNCAMRAECFYLQIVAESILWFTYRTNFPAIGWLRAYFFC